MSDMKSARTMEDMPEDMNPDMHPDHYNFHEHECWDEMEMIFGTEWTMIFCLLNVWKYRYRAPEKGTAAQDASKSDVYIDKFAEMKDKLLNGREVSGIVGSLKDAGLPFN